MAGKMPAPVFTPPPHPSSPAARPFHQQRAARLAAGQFRYRHVARRGLRQSGRASPKAAPREGKNARAAADPSSSFAAGPDFRPSAPRYQIHRPGYTAGTGPPAHLSASPQFFLAEMTSPLLTTHLLTTHLLILRQQYRPAVERSRIELLFDPQKLVVFGHAVGARGGAGLDLPRVHGDSQVGDRGVFRLAAAMAGNAGVAIPMGQMNRRDGFGERADLVHFDQNAVGDAFVDSPLQALGVGHEQVVADELNLAAELLGEHLPALPIVFGTAVFDRDDRITGAPGGPEIDHLARRDILAVDLIRLRV